MFGGKLDPELVDDILWRFVPVLGGIRAVVRHTAGCIWIASIIIIIMP